MQRDLEFLALLIIAHMCEISHHTAVSKTVLWRAIITVGEVDGTILFMEPGETADPDRMAPRLQTILSQMAETRQGLIDMVDNRISLRPLGQDWINATSDFTAYEQIVEQLACTIPTLIAV